MCPPGWSSTSPEPLQPARGPASGPASPASVDLYWLPLGAGGRCVRVNGLVYEALAARLARRERRALYHSALVVSVDGEQFAIEMAPVWNTPDPERGVTGEGPVGVRALGRLKLFRYEVRCWRAGRIPDVDEAVDSPRRLSNESLMARRILDLVPEFPLATWGADQQHTGDMWNSNSLVSWLLARSGHDCASVSPPAGGRAPGWSAGLVVAMREDVGRPPLGTSGTDVEIGVAAGSNHGRHG